MQVSFQYTEICFDSCSDLIPQQARQVEEPGTGITNRVCITAICCIWGVHLQSSLLQRTGGAGAAMLTQDD
eukprot:2938212-Amphidinium_carterae.1